MSDSLPFPEMSRFVLFLLFFSELGFLRGCEVSGFPSSRPGAPTLCSAPGRAAGRLLGCPRLAALETAFVRLNDRFCLWKSARFLGLEDRKYPRGQAVGLWVRILPGKVRCSDSGRCSGRRGPALPEVGTCCRCAGSRSVVQPHQCF